MKKNSFYFILLILIAGCFTSCEKKIDTEGVSRITYYPVFEVTGESELLLALNSTFTDPGVVAKENGAVIPIKMSIVGENTGFKGTAIPMNVPDKYTITYEATNSDGFSANVQRVVWVFQSEDLSTGIAGLYTSTIKRGSAAVTLQYTDLKYIIISKASGSTYNISCAIGGYYSIGRAYGPTYNAVGGTITMNNLATNDFSFTKFTIPGFGNTVDISSIVVNAAAKTIVIKSAGNFANSVFQSTLTQVQL